MKKIGLYGGTFNPVHCGHLNLAFELMEKGGLDEVWWVPTYRSPLRMDDILAEPRLRYKMVELAVEEIPQFKVLDTEINMLQPAYTIDTVKEILEKHRDKQFYLLLADETIHSLMEWKDPLELVKLVPLLIGRRAGGKLPHFPEEIEAAIKKGMLETSMLDISATKVRERIRKRLYTAHLIPTKVLDFIYVNQLYFTV